jgi:[acyl-carrier-protein] S-malonyltransferase
MGKDLFDSSSKVRDLYAVASKEIGDDLARVSFEGPTEVLKQTRFTQPAILVHSLSVLTILGNDLPEFDYVAGHSLGEYGALAVSGALSFGDAIKAVVKRAYFMEQACSIQDSSMAAILGLSADRVTEICEISAGNGIVVPANFNGSAQTVVSGEPGAVKEVVALAQNAGAKRAIMLDVGGAFHSPIMESAGIGMSEYLKNTKINPPTCPVIANVSATAETDPDRIRRLLVEQITAPVRWTETMQWLSSHEVTTVTEIGPGKVLTGMARREMQLRNVFNLDKLTDIESFVSVTV